RGIHRRLVDVPDRHPLPARPPPTRPAAAGVRSAARLARRALRGGAHHPHHPGLAFGLMPALQSTRRDLGVDFRDVTATDRRDSRKLQNTLVTLQVAVCLILLLSAGLLARGLYRAQTIDPGINMA